MGIPREESTLGCGREKHPLDSLSWNPSWTSHSGYCSSYLTESVADVHFTELQLNGLDGWLRRCLEAGQSALANGCRVLRDMSEVWREGWEGGGGDECDFVERKDGE